MQPKLNIIRIRNKNFHFRYLKLGTTGKSVPGVKAKVTPSNDSGQVKTPRLDNGATSDNVGEVENYFYAKTELNVIKLFRGILN